MGGLDFANLKVVFFENHDDATGVFLEQAGWHDQGLTWRRMALQVGGAGLGREFEQCRLHIRGRRSGNLYRHNAHVLQFYVTAGF